jgi:hypothetical protein
MNEAGLELIVNLVLNGVLKVMTPVTLLKGERILRKSIVLTGNTLDSTANIGVHPGHKPSATVKVKGFNGFYDAEQAFLNEILSGMLRGHPRILGDDFMHKGGVLLYDGGNRAGIALDSLLKQVSGHHVSFKLLTL